MRHCANLKSLKHTTGGDFHLEDFLTIVCSQGCNLTVLEAWFLPCLRAPPVQLTTLSHLKVHVSIDTGSHCPLLFICMPVLS